jgi:hypothetical protein
MTKKRNGPATGKKLKSCKVSLIPGHFTLKIEAAWISEGVTIRKTSI